MRIFKATFQRDGNGRTRTANKWSVEFPDHRAIVRRVTLFTDKTATTEAARKLVALVDRKRASESPGADLLAFVESMPARTRNYLARIGLLDAHRMAASRALCEHLDEFKAAIVAKGSTELHAGKTLARIRKCVDACGFTYWTDVDPMKVAAWLRGLHAGGTAAQTVNYYAKALAQFARWMMRERRASENPLVNLPRFKGDARRERRALTAVESRKLLAATAAGPDRAGIAGHERAMVYKLALESGLRANEIRSLTRASFDFTGHPATVTVDAGSTKNRKRAVLPLREGTASELQEHLRHKLPAAPAFNIPKHWRSAEMIATDLHAAGVAVDDDAGTVDFHALRHSFVSGLARAQVHPKTAMALARHSDINLTMRTYSHSLREDELEAVNRLPDLSAPIPEAATGTEGAFIPQAPAACAFTPRTVRGNDAETCLASCLAETGGQTGNSGDVDRRNSASLQSVSAGRKLACDRGEAAYSGHPAQECGPVAQRLEQGTHKA